MFHMEFHSLDAVEEDEDQASPCQNEVSHSTTAFEQCRQSSSDSHVKVYEGRVGKFGRMQRVVSSNEVVHTVSHIPSLAVIRTRSLDSETSRSLNSETSRSLNLETSRSLDLETSIPSNWVEVDLIDFSDSPKAPQPTTSAAEQEVIRELVKPFADSVNLTNNGGVSLERRPSIPDFLSNGVEEGDVVVDAVSSGDGNISGSLPVQTDSISSTNSTSSANCIQSRIEGSETESSTTEEKVCVKDEEKGGPASNSLNKAFNKFMHHKKSKPVVGESKEAKPWDEPLLHAHEQAKVERKAQKEAKVEAKRMAEAAKREAGIQQRELLELANPFPESSLRNHGVLQGRNLLNRFRGGASAQISGGAVHKLFHSHGGSQSHTPSLREGAHGDVREAKLVMPRAGMFEASPGMSPATADIALAQIRSAPRPVTKTDLQFATVESHQRDVRPWTMEEYMAKNARLQEWENRENDEEFGGIDGNQLLSQYIDNDAVLNDFDDSDTD